MQPLVIYHSHCMDGFTAAWVANQFLCDAELRPMAYTDEPPTDDDVRGREVYVVDFSFKRAVCERIAAAASSLVVLDHHRTAQQELEPLCARHATEEALGDFVAPSGWMNLQVYFDMERSGAGMAWDFFSDEPRPWLVDYVEDRDLWRFKLPGSREVNACVACTSMTLEDYTARCEFGVRIAESLGAGALAFEQMCARVAAETAMIVRFEGYDVPFVNVSHELRDATAGLLAESAPFAVGWFQKSDGTFQYSLRSRSEGGVDVSEIAKKYGGGGHRNASGFNHKLLLTDPFRKNLEWSDANMFSSRGEG